MKPEIELNAAPLTSIGIDIGKEIFHVVGLGTDGKIAFRRKIKRLALKEAFEKLPPCIVGMGRYVSEDLERIDLERQIWAVMRAAEACAFNELSVSKSLWAEAQRVLGLWPATLAVMLVAAKDPNYFSRTPAHYFAGMVEKAKQGSLRLDRSIWGLRTKSESAGQS